MARETLRPSEMRRAAREARRDKQSGLTLADLRARQDALKAATPTYTNPNQAPLERTDDFGSKEHKPSRDLSQRIIDAEAKKNKLDLSD